MTPLLIAGSAVVDGLGGGLIGLWYGFATDTSDFPMLAAMTGPIGAAVGAVVGAAAGSVVFA